MAADQSTNPSAGLIQAINLPDVLGMTLKALVEGDAIAAVKSADFITEFGFVPDAKNPGSAGKLRTIEFTYDRMDAGGEIQTATVAIPVISLIPLPLLSIGQATIAFELEVMGASSQGTTGTSRVIDSPVSSVRIPHSDLHVRFAPTSGAGPTVAGDPGKTSARSNMSVSIDVRQSDLPASLSQFLALASEAMVQQLAAAPKSPSLQIISPASGTELKVRAPPLGLVARLSKPDGRAVKGQKIFVSQSGEPILTFSDTQPLTDSNGEVHVGMSCSKRGLAADVTKTVFVTAPIPGEAKGVIEISAQTTVKVVPAK